ncbi:MAG TPA: DUF5103 domain-containing protein [Bacteroidales bacterium]|nr:DUF5103 domain-containing protein [Bacteroidales bacterium]
MSQAFFSFKIQNFSAKAYRNVWYILFLGFCFLSGASGQAKEFHDSGKFSGRERQRARQAETVVLKDFFLFGDHIYSKNIHTILFHPEGDEFSPPRIRLNSGEQLVLIFDDLDADFKNYYYTIIHCDANWQPTNLQKFEYIQGFHEDIIRDYSRSINTLVPYTQYFLEFPNRNIAPGISGNYILKVYLNGNPNEVVFTRRFVIYEQLVGIEGMVRPATLLMYRETHQQLSFSINTLNYPVSNPNQDLRVVITQNGRRDNALTGIAPRLIQGNRITFDHEKELLFESGNEFRRFDIRSLRFRSERIGEIMRSSMHYEVFLLPDQLRAFRSFLTERDINGKFEINTHDAKDKRLEGDYAWVHFRLPVHEPFEDASVHILGGLTCWSFTENNKMSFNPATRAYEANLLLKQGFYNYNYALLEEGENTARLADIEGSFSEAENEYTIYVFHRRPGTLYDRLIGLRSLNSRTVQISPR